MSDQEQRNYYNRLRTWKKDKNGRELIPFDPGFLHPKQVSYVPVKENGRWIPRLDTNKNNLKSEHAFYTLDEKLTMEDRCLTKSNTNTATWCVLGAVGAVAVPAIAPWVCGGLALSYGIGSLRAGLARRESMLMIRNSEGDRNIGGR
ncbi:MAG: hypothetical protein FJX22_03035 [Alphaproteobacteria bacterium]|nr:hypothetical protein [Alphaproteobacteria bacterium]